MKLPELVVVVGAGDRRVVGQEARLGAEVLAGRQILLFFSALL